MSAPAQSVRSARGFLRTKLKAGTSDISPRHFANAAQELGMGFSGVAAVLARLYAGGQNESFYREAALEENLDRGGT
jgi:hypothetical protein